jgi:acyl carrier protein/phosphopantetheinyl transferase (holo-ACP synthase)
LIETELNMLKPVLVLEMLTVASSKKIYRLKIKYEQRRDFRTIRDIINPTSIVKKVLKTLENTDFISDLNINSANLVDIILDVEDHFKIHIDNESMEKMVDVNIRNNRFQIKSTVIGNDIVDLALARKESNWKRPGYLNKIFTTKEQLLISSAENPNTMVWNLWSRKEAYKIYNRATGIRGYFPLNLECAYENSTTGSVAWDIHSMKTVIDAEKIHTIAVTKRF